MAKEVSNKIFVRAVLVMVFNHTLKLNNKGNTKFLDFLVV